MQDQNSRPLVTVAIRIAMTDYVRLEALARRRGLVTRQGKAVISRAASVVISEALDTLDVAEPVRGG